MTPKQTMNTGIITMGVLLLLLGVSGMAEQLEENLNMSDYDIYRVHHINFTLGDSYNGTEICTRTNVRCNGTATTVTDIWVNETGDSMTGTLDITAGTG